jgi:hypothetical protein
MGSRPTSSATAFISSKEMPAGGCPPKSDDRANSDALLRMRANSWSVYDFLSSLIVDLHPFGRIDCFEPDAAT